eukprot:1338112-Prymnesium_polylepis.1
MVEVVRAAAVEKRLNVGEVGLQRCGRQRLLVANAVGAGVEPKLELIQLRQQIPLGVLVQVDLSDERLRHVVHCGRDADACGVAARRSAFLGRNTARENFAGCEPL